MNKSMTEIGKIVVPTWEKYLLTVREASKYFHIGEKKLRMMIEENSCADWFLMNGNRVMIKRKAFEMYLNEATAV